MFELESVQEQLLRPEVYSPKRYIHDFAPKWAMCEQNFEILKVGRCCPVCMQLRICFVIRTLSRFPWHEGNDAVNTPMVQTKNTMVTPTPHQRHAWNIYNKIQLYQCSVKTTMACPACIVVHSCVHSPNSCPHQPMDGPVDPCCLASLCRQPPRPGLHPSYQCGREWSSLEPTPGRGPRPTPRAQPPPSPCLRSPGLDLARSLARSEPPG